VRSVQPDDAPAPAETRYPHPLRIALAGRLCPVGGRIEIRQNLFVGDFGHDLGQDFLDIA
jgi:hypothetical protein